MNQLVGRAGEGILDQRGSVLSAEAYHAFFPPLGIWAVQMLTISSKWWKLLLRVFDPHGSSEVPLSHSVRDFSFMEECIYKSRQTHLRLMSGFPLTRYLTP